MNAIGHYFGLDNNTESAERFAQWMDVERMHAAWDGDRIVGGAGAISYRMSMPGGAIPTAGVTVVGVQPTHRRRGVLTALMRDQLEDCRARGEPAAYLWASESTIYPRFGYGLAGVDGRDDAGDGAHRVRAAVRAARHRALVDVEEAARDFPPLYEQVFAQRPGLFSRTPAWWETRRLVPSPWAPQPARSGSRCSSSMANPRLRDLHREPGLGARLVRRQGGGDRGGQRRLRRRRASCGGGCSTSTGPRSSRRACCRSTIRCSCCSPSRGACSSRSVTASGCG